MALHVSAGISKSAENKGFFAVGPVKTASNCRKRVKRQEDWTLDVVGNWKDYDVQQDGNATLNQARTHNKVNEITAIGQDAN